MSANANRVERFQIDPKESRFLVHVEATGLLSMFGHNPTIAVCGFGGDVRCDPETLEGASLLLLVQANSLAVADDVSEKDRREIERGMREDALETSRHAEIVYMSRSVAAERAGEGVFRIRIDGDLSLHGVTRTQPVKAEIRIDGDALRARGELSLRQSDYRIRPVAALGGALKVKDEVRLSFDIIARKR